MSVSQMIYEFIVAGSMTGLYTLTIRSSRMKWICGAHPIAHRSARPLSSSHLLTPTSLCSNFQATSTNNGRLIVYQNLGPTRSLLTLFPFQFLFLRSSPAIHSQLYNNHVVLLNSRSSPFKGAVVSFNPLVRPFVSRVDF